MKPTFNGDTLILPPWQFADPEARVPHRSHVLAFGEQGRNSFYVRANHKQSLFWVHAVGPGFAGVHSRASATCVTRVRALADKWIIAVMSGKVRIDSNPKT